MRIPAPAGPARLPRSRTDHRRHGPSRIRAEVADVPHFSAHADADQVIDWLRVAPAPHTTPTSSTERRTPLKPCATGSMTSWAGRPSHPSPGRPSWSADRGRTALRNAPRGPPGPHGPRSTVRTKVGGAP
ncbi:MBL fold metallo-hydrolase RNA specificity domain-containing protein [Streptomyces sp. NPDC049949]|uniref:MBL fold metallo-hydrolase RNA specificity domain-containing protein n=1 Tax=Streptomyces sp. NPDC049949 TaxID=3154627 RepID=UPI0034357889